MHGQADTPLPPNSADGRWYAHVGGRNYGPYVRRDIERMVQSGQILGTDFPCIVGGSAWVQADAAPEFCALFQTRPPLALWARTPGPSKVYKARRALQLWRGLIVIAIGLLGFLPLRHIGDWLAGGPKPEAERFFVLAFLLLLPIGALRLFNALRGLPDLTVARQGIKLDLGLWAKSACWDSLEPFAIRIVGTSPLGKRFRIATATIIGPNKQNAAAPQDFPHSRYFCRADWLDRCATQRRTRLSRAAVLSGGEWYRLFTAPLLHANLPHIVGNGVALLWGGWLLERLVGRLWFFCFFAVGALGGSLLSPSIGHIDYGAHFGGALSGAAMAALLLKHWPQTARLPQLRPVAIGIAASGGTLFAASAGIAIAKYSKYDVTFMPRAELPKPAGTKVADNLLQPLAAHAVAGPRCGEPTVRL